MNLKLAELNTQEIKNIDGGFYIIKITGFLDGIDGNFQISLFGDGNN